MSAPTRCSPKQRMDHHFLWYGEKSYVLGSPRHSMIFVHISQATANVPYTISLGKHIPWTHQLLLFASYAALAATVGCCQNVSSSLLGRSKGSSDAQDYMKLFLIKDLPDLYTYERAVTLSFRAVLLSLWSH